MKLKNPCICIAHFKDEDIEGALKFEMGELAPTASYWK